MHDYLCIGLFNQTYKIFISLYALATRKLREKSGTELQIPYYRSYTLFFCFYLFSIALILYVNHHILYMLLLRIHPQIIPETPKSHLTCSTPSLISVISSSSISLN